jgi:hypothetical protein
LKCSYRVFVFVFSCSGREGKESIGSDGACEGCCHHGGYQQMPRTCAQIWHQGVISANFVCVGVMELRFVPTWIDGFSMVYLLMCIVT